MIANSQYELLDFGQGEKLESFAGLIVRRETPSAIGNRRESERWGDFHVRGRVVDDSFLWTGEIPEDWCLDAGEFQFGLRQTKTGQVGIFPEQADNWAWITNCRLPLEGKRALNLFAYTGGTTMALAARGVEVVHVDSAKSVVNWARQNATRSRLEDSNIRWIVEDVMTFVAREIRRGNQYDIVVADPPSFGRGPKGEFWKIQRDIEGLVQSLAQLTSGASTLGILSCHTPGIDHRDLKRFVKNAFSLRRSSGEGFEMFLDSAAGARLPSGHCFRWLNPI